MQGIVVEFSDLKEFIEEIVVAGAHTDDAVIRSCVLSRTAPHTPGIYSFEAVASIIRDGQIIQVRSHLGQSIRDDSATTAQIEERAATFRERLLEVAGKHKLALRNGRRYWALGHAS